MRPRPHPNQLRRRLILIFLLATLVPLGLTLWTSLRLLDRSLALAPLSQLDAVSQSLKNTGRELYQQARESLREDVAAGRIPGRRLSAEEARSFRERGASEAFEIAGERGNRLDYYLTRQRKAGDEVWV